MDILTHTLSGAAVGALVGAGPDRSWKAKVFLFAVGAFAGALPDIDAITRMSDFDDTFGAWLSLETSGRAIYRGKWWYSHHAFTHSLLWCALLSAGVLGISRRSRLGRTGVLAAWVAGLGSLAHIVGDMPTPAGPWGGVALLFPLSTYVGGWNWTWWWNNYDVLLLLLALNGLLAAISFSPLRKRRWLAPTLAAAALALITWQLTHRTEVTSPPGSPPSWRDSERASLEYQRELLGPTLYGWMERLDRALPMPF